MNIHYVTVRSAGPNGYGTSSRDLEHVLTNLGVQCDKQFSGQKIALIYHHPEAIEQTKADVKILYTMFESDVPPEGWRKYIKQADIVINPTKWGAETFKRKYGIDVKVVPLGIKTDQFYYRDRIRNENDPFTFLQYDCNRRKGFIETWEAFRQEFSEDENVRMVFKTARLKNTFPPLWPNMETIVAEYTTQELMALLHKADCFVFPSQGEGFGHTPLEAMASGLPVITMNQHGISEYFNNNYMLHVDAFPTRAEYDFIHEDNLGVMYKADIKSLREAMRFSFNNKFLSGKEASEYARKFTWERTGQQLLDILHTINQ